MDPITAAIVAALPSLASDAVKSAYEGLKAVIKRKWGDTAPLSKAIAALEADPGSKAQEKVVAIKAAQDPEVVDALGVLVEQLKTEGLGGNAVPSITLNISGGTQTGVIGAQTVSAGRITFGKI
jgi:hypothetical protein